MRKGINSQLVLLKHLINRLENFAKLDNNKFIAIEQYFDIKFVKTENKRF